MILKYIYTVFLGILLATFIGVGIAAFYPEPKQPDYPVAPYATKPILEEQYDSTEAARIRRQEVEYQQVWKEHQEISQQYNRNVSIISLAFSIIILIISLTLVKNLPYIADGSLLGGVLTLLYSIVRGFGSEDNMYRFVVVTIGLIIALILGYIKFIRASEKKS